MNAKVVGILVLLLLLCAFLSYAAPESFLKGNNIENLARRTALFGIIGVGVAFVIITGGIDLSIGSTVCLSGILLAMFLHVDYSPPDEHDVFAVRGEERQVYLRYGADGFQKDDRIRYYRGVRVSDAIVGVKQVDAADLTIAGESIRCTRLVVDGDFSNDDEAGRIAKVYNVLSYTKAGDDQSEVTIEGDHTDLARRDKINFVDASNGRRKKELDVLSTRQEGEATIILLKQKYEETFSQEWLAIPIHRKQFMPVPLAILCVLVIAIGLGACHGLLVTKLDLPPFLVTLCGLLIYRGISRWLVRDQVQGFGVEYESNLSSVASGQIDLWGGFAIPNAFLIMLLVAVAASVFLNRSIWGRYMLALGNNEEAARFSGINTHAMIIMAYVICTVTAALGGMLFALDANSISPSSFGNLYELYAIAAAVLGGCSLRGGEGSVLGVVVGTALMQTLNNVIVLLRISNELEYTIIGSVILIGVIADVLIKRLVVLQRADKRRRVLTYQRSLCYLAPANLIAALFYCALRLLEGPTSGVFIGMMLLIASGLGCALIVFLAVRDIRGWSVGSGMGLLAVAPGLTLVIAVAALFMTKRYIDLGETAEANG